MNKFFPFVSIILLSLISIQSCSTCKHKRNKNETDIAFEKGKVIQNVTCRKDITQSYSLYLPSKYNKDQKWPVVYAFDSHGKGLIPVELFKDEAEMYGYIVVGSNNSKNGTPWKITSVIYDTLYSDTHHRFSIDDSRIYTAGFSGGSRVASTVAITKGGVNAVIGCGAGFGSQQQPSQKFSYFGVAGNIDMNLNEMIALDSALEKSGFRHYLHTFDGKHEWPPKSVVSDAFLWLELNAMKDKLKPVDEALVKSVFSSWSKRYDSLSGKGNSYEAYLLCKKIINYFDGLTDISKMKTDLTKQESSPVITQIRKHLNDIAKKETDQQSYYSNAISTQTADWWRSQVALINQKINTTPDNEEKFMYKRVLNYLSLADYMNVSGAMKAGQFAQADKFNTIYALVDPENPEHAYISAILSMKQGKPQDAILYLEKAAELGFAEPDRIEGDTVMTSLKQNDKYSKILETIKNNIKKKQ